MSSGWIKQFKTDSYPELYGLATSSNGYSYVVGRTSGSINGEIYGGDYDGLIAKYDDLGNLLWTRLSNETTPAWYFDVAIAGGGIYTAGINATTSWTAEYGTFTKFDSDGNLQWKKYTPNQIIPRSIDSDSENLFISGVTAQTVAGQSMLGAVLKYDQSGNLLTSILIDGGYATLVNGIKSSTNGDIIVVGSTTGTVSSVSPFTSAGSGNIGSSDAFISSYNSEGNLNWSYQFGAPLLPDQATSVAISGDGSIYVGGKTYSNLNDQKNIGNQDVFVAKFSSAGDFQWVKQFGSTEADSVNSLVVDSNGDIFAGGYSYGSFGGQKNKGSPDAFITKMNSDGSVVDTVFLGTPYDEEITGIAFSGDAIYASGFTGGDFQNFKASPKRDGFLFKVFVGLDIADIFNGGDVDEVVAGAGGNDVLNGFGGNDHIYGGSGDDLIKGGSGSNVLDGGVGIDTAEFDDKTADLDIQLSAGNATVTVGTEVNILIDIENINGGSGNDTLYGDDKANHLKGGKGKDVIKAGKGNDRVDGGDGDDLIIGGDGAGDDIYIGGDGEDTVKYTSATAGITLNLATGAAFSTAGNDAAAIGIDQISSIENVIAGDYSDTITGDTANNKITGGKGNDSIDGGAGTDTAIFSAARSAYKISAGSSAGSYLVTSNDDGIDLVSNIEYFQFSDKTYATTELVLDSNSGGSGGSGSSITNPNNRSPSGKLSITGTFTQGKTLTVSDTLSDKDGIPKAGQTGAIAYSWYADGVQIDGATSSNLLLKQEHVNKTISVKASYIDLGSTAEFVILVAKSVTNVNDTPTGKVTITGTVKQNEALSVSNDLADLDGLGVISYQWKAGGKNIVGATSDTLTLAQAQVGQTISVTASYTDGFGKKESISSVLTSKVANINDLPTGQLTISGTAAEDQTLRAVTSSLADADGLGTFKYQWQSSSDGSTWTSIKGATAATYKLGDSVVGKYVRATVSYTDKLGTAESVLGESTGLVANVNDKPVGLPTITGKFIEGETLTANVSKITDADGLGTFSYLWQTSTDKKTWLDASTDATFQLSGTSAKQFVQLVVNFTDGNGTAESVKSVASAAIATKALTLLGTLSDDNLVGMSGNDTLYGNIGSDTLRGGAGNDIFLYRSVNDSLPQSFDYILDFSAGDKIDLKGIDANTAVAGDQAFAFKTEATKNAVWWNSNMLYGDVNGDAIADFAIQVSLVGLSELKATNIIL